jgi:hypothetical protein
MIDKMGTQLSRSDFWYIDRPEMWSYLGWFRKEKAGEPPLQLFIELWPGVFLDEVGYPELLLDDRSAKGKNLKGYSYSKYLNNRIITQSGEYKYNLDGNIFQTDPSEYHTVFADNLEHLVYRPDENNMIVLSSYSPKISDLIINFSCIFIFFFFSVSFCLLIVYFPSVRQGFRWNFRNKIQYSLITIIMVSFAIIGSFTVYYVYSQYQKKNYDIVKEKMKSIHTELSNAILFQNSFDDDDDKEILTGLLSEYQRLFLTDINLFNIHGQLIATSFPDVFDKGMMGRQINPNAYIKLYYGQRASILEHEEIGGLHYISAYEPFLDDDNRVIGFLNLPYRSEERRVGKECQ